MTNGMIILQKSISLMNQGILEGTGEMVTLDDGTEVELPEEIHTFAYWKSNGYSVKKGEKAIAKFLIWKRVIRKAKEEGEEDTAKMFLKKAAFFKGSQVEAITK